MEETKFSWPRELNLQLLESVLSEDELLELIRAHMGKSREKRTILLPSTKICKKVWFHSLWRRVLNGETTWPKEKKALKKRWGSLTKAEIRKDRIKEAFKQRQKEILEEILSEEKSCK